MLLRNGFPVDFNGALETGSYEDIEPTRALMALSAGLVLGIELPGFHDVPLDPQLEIYRRLGRALPTCLASAELAAERIASPAIR